jgi:hypothetical protein
MPRTCTACRHPERAEIDRQLVRGAPFRHIAAHYGVSTGALQRHGQEHIPKLLAGAAEAEAADADSLLAEVRELQERTLRLLGAAEAAGDLPSALKAVHQARANLELLGKLAGELSAAPTVNVLVSAEWGQLRATILHALDAFPPARLAVAEALALEAGD